MDRRSDDSSVANAGLSVAAPSRATWPRTLLSAVLPPLGAFGIQTMFAAYVPRWALLYPAVFLSSWLGGFGSGVTATMLSTAIVWWYLVPPQGSLFKSDPRYVVAAVVFVFMGVLASALQGRLRRLNREAAEALDESRRTTEQLRQVVDERRIFAALVENSSDFIGIADAEGNPTYVNPAGRRMVGLEANFPVSSTKIAHYYPPELRQFATDVIFKEMLARGHWQGETSFRHWRTEQMIPVSDTHFLVRDPESGRLLGMATITRDISSTRRDQNELEAANRRLAEALRELNESQRFLQAILDYTPNGIAIKDLDGHYILINRRLEQVIGMSAAAAKGKSDLELFPREVAERFRNNDRIVRDTMAPLITEERAQRHEAARIFLVNKFPLLEDDGRAFALCAIWQDITERKRAEEAMRQSAADLAEAQRVSHLGSWSWNPRTGDARWSDELYRIFGLDPTAPPPRLLSADSDVFTSESRERLVAAMEKLFKHGTPYELDLELNRPDGTTRWVAARGDAVRDPRGNIVELSGTAQDVTQLRELERLREEWTSVIAHDLRQPIGVIKMAADFLPALHTGETNEKEQDITRRIAAAARTLSRMVDDLLDMSLLEADRLKLERRWMDPSKIVKESIDRLSQVMSGRHVRVLHGADLAQVFVDPMRIGQVLGNLMSNAVKYGDEGTEIIVRVDRRDSEAQISVTNRGKGIAAEELPRIFSRFSRSRSANRSAVQGLGLGLYIAKGVIEAHGGRMWAESTPGETTTFYLTLPCRATAKEAA